MNTTKTNQTGEGNAPRVFPVNMSVELFTYYKSCSDLVEQFADRDNYGLINSSRLAELHERARALASQSKELSNRWTKAEGAGATEIKY